MRIFHHLTTQKKTMFKYFFIFIIGLLLSSCTSVGELIENGQYDQAIRKGIQKLSKTPNDAVAKKNILKAHGLAHKKDLENLKSLREMEETTSSLEMIYKVYSKMKRRDLQLEQANVKTPILSRVPIREMQFAHDKMCANFADIAEEKMQKNNRLNYQNAYSNWNKALKYQCDITDLDSLMNVCISLGKSLVVLQLDVQKNVALPEKTKTNLENLSYINNNKLGKWIEFVNDYKLDQKIDYTVVCTFNQVAVSDNKQTVKKTEVKKQIIDRYETRKNADGKTQKVPVYITAKATLYQYTQEKNSTQGVYFEIIDNLKKTKLYQKQLVGKSEFNNKYTLAKGDLRALSKDQKKLIKRKKKAYPTNSYMITESGRQLKSVVERKVYQQRTLLE